MSIRRAGARAPQARAGFIPGFIPLAAAAAVMASGCAYYNTFYSARKHYEDAERQHLTSGLEHPTPAVLELYQRSIQRSRKVIAQYSDSKWVDDARYLIGMAHLRREEWDQATAAFEELISKHPDSKLVPDARLGMGLAQLGRGAGKEAEKTFRALLADYPRLERRDELLYQLARSHARRREHRPAIFGFTQLLDHDPDGALEVDALKSRGEAYLAVGAPDSALADFQELVRLLSRPEQRFEAELQVGESLERLGRYAEALDHYARLERAMPGPNQLPRTLLARARALGDQGRHEEALALYERVARDFPTSNYAAQAQYQIGLTHELHLGQLEQAKEAYARVRQTSSASEFAELAEQRRQSLDLFGQYHQEIASSGEEEKKAQAAFLLAELSLFRMRKVDEALAQYQAVERDYPQSSVASKAAFAVAWIHQHERADSATAVAWYRHVFDRYPDTEHGVHAGVMAGRLSADSLSIHLGRVLRIRAAADSLLAIERLAAADSLAALGLPSGSDTLALASSDPPGAVARPAGAVAGADTAGAVAGGDTSAAAGGDSSAVAGGDTSAAAGGDTSAAGGDTSAAAGGDSVLGDPYSGVPPSERPVYPDSALAPSRRTRER